MDSGTLVIVLVLFLIVGTPVLLVVAGLIRAATSRNFTRRAARASALVIDVPPRHEWMQIGGGNQIVTEVYEPIVRFQPPNAAVIDARIEVPLHTPSVQVGQTTEILYDPARPQRVRLASADGASEGRRIATVGCLAALLMPLVVLLAGGIVLYLLRS